MARTFATTTEVHLERHFDHRSVLTQILLEETRGRLYLIGEVSALLAFLVAASVTLLSHPRRVGKNTSSRHPFPKYFERCAQLISERPLWPVGSLKSY